MDVFVEGYHADKVISRRFKTHPKWGARDRRVYAESVYDIVRNWRWFWHLSGLSEQEFGKKDSIDEDRLWIVWATYWVSRDYDLPAWEQFRSIVVNKIKQRVHRKVKPAIQYSMPDWLDQLGSKEFGEAAWVPIMAALSRPADVYLRVNTLKINVRNLRQKLAAEEIETDLVPELDAALKLSRRYNVFASKLFKDGYFEVQDWSSQHVAPFLQVESGMRVVDACAGAGGKSLHLATLMANKGKIISLDVHQWKLDELRKRASRNGADTIETRVIADKKVIKRLAGSADRVLLDVPCSGLGVLRRNPDTKWKLKQEELDRLVILQQEILEGYASMVKVGGKLVYATCSILPSENEKQVQKFLSKNSKNWELEEELKLLPNQIKGDGFYAARLKRIA